MSVFRVTALVRRAERTEHVDHQQFAGDERDGAVRGRRSGVAEGRRAGGLARAQEGHVRQAQCGCGRAAPWQRQRRRGGSLSFVRHRPKPVDCRVSGGGEEVPVQGQ